MRIFLTGDLHGDYDIHKLSSKNFNKGSELSKDDIVIILGDFGLLWDPVHNISNRERYWIKWLADKPWTTLFVCGNHENFDRLDSLETVEKFGAPVGKVNDSIFHLRRGYIYNLDGITFFTFGGGNSIDKAGRMPGVSWWERELPNYMEMKRGLDNLTSVGYEVDFILAHECPTSIIKKIYSHHNEPYQLTEYLEEVVKRTSFAGYFFGHHHQNITIDEKYTCLYNKIVEIKGP